MRTMLVVPGEPSGTPATMITPSPALAKPSSKAMRQALRTMAAWFSGSLVRTQCTPQAMASLRPVATTGDRPMTGRPGRSRATRSAVEPVAV